MQEPPSLRGGHLRTVQSLGQPHGFFSSFLCLFSSVPSPQHFIRKPHLEQPPLQAVTRPLMLPSGGGGRPGVPLVPYSSGCAVRAASVYPQETGRKSPALPGVNTPPLCLRRREEVPQEAVPSADDSCPWPGVSPGLPLRSAALGRSPGLHLSPVWSDSTSLSGCVSGLLAADSVQ